MPKKIKTDLTLYGFQIHIRKKYSKSSYSYELRYRRDGYNISVGAKTKAELKEKFLNAILHAKPQEKKEEIPSFQAVAEKWFSFKKKKWTPENYKITFRQYEKYILPHFSDRKISAIKAYELQSILDDIEDQGLTRTRESVRTVMKGIFDFAADNYFIERNPIRATTFVRYDRETKNSLSIEEENFLIQRLETDPFFADVKDDIYVMLFCGLRPCELQDVRFEGDFLIARNRKRKHGKIEYKKIPLAERAKRYLNRDHVFGQHSTAVLNDRFKRIFPNYTQYCLRHTFATRCQMFVRQEIVNIWLGDAPDKLIGRHYTHFPDDFMLKEMEKVRY